VRVSGAADEIKVDFHPGSSSCHNPLMKTRTLVPVEEYLTTDYEPDCDYVDGELIERNVGEKKHSKAQRFFTAFFYNQRAALGIHVFPEQRIQVAPRRYRVPDICVVVGEEPDEEIFTKPPFLCIEILSPEDRASRMQPRIMDYIAFGVSYIWVIDPWNRRAFIYTQHGMREAQEILETEDPKISIPLAEAFD
jgi:Uma2 family endonuclease